MENTIYDLGYGILTGTHEERMRAFQKRLEDIRRGIGKPITIVDIRKAGSGSINGAWFRQVSGMVVIERHMYSMIQFLDSIDYVAKPMLANTWGSTLRNLKSYEYELSLALVDPPIEQGMREAFDGVKAIASAQERAVVLLCGCKQAFKPNGTTWNCHRVPLANALVKELGPEWSIVHL